MKKKIWTGAALLICLALLLSGCSYQILTPDQLMRPPRYYGENAGLQEAFTEAAPNAVLKAPYEGDYHSAFILTDLDGDGAEEALAFYVNNMDKNICRMMLFRWEQGSWTLCATVRGEGSDVVSVSTGDLDADGVREIIVGWGISGSQERTLSVYRYTPQSGNLRSLASESYRLMACVDFDGDAEQELFVVSSISPAAGNGGTDLGASRFRVRLLKIQEAVQPDGTQAVSVTAVSELMLPSSVTECRQIVVQPAVEDNPQAIFLDCTLGESGMFTDIIVWSGGKLTRVETGTAENPFRDTYRTANITCRDINQDGYFEIPAQMVLDGGVNSSAAIVNGSASDAGSEKTADDQMYLTVWHQFSKGKLIPCANSVLNFNDSYMFLFQSGWTSGNFPNMTNNVTVEANIGTRTWSFYDYDYQTKVRGSLIFEIIVHPVGTDISATDEEEILTDGGLIYTVRMGVASASRDVTYEDVVEGFMLLDS